MPATRQRTKRTAFVGEKVRRIRKERGLTQSELAQRIHVIQSDLCRMEKGEYKVSLDVLFRILAVFEMNVAEFFNEPGAGASSQEQELVEAFRDLPYEARVEVLDFVRFKVRQLDRPEATEEVR
jgi:transcriptional regulator with XRE-family HTH domain